MKTKLTLLSILFFSLSSCDLNDDDENGTFSLYFRASIDGVSWIASPDHIGASLDNNGISPLVRIHGDLSGTNDYFYILFPPLIGIDTTITSTGFAGRMEYHRNAQTWVSVSGNLIIHDQGYPQHHEYVGTFSGTFFNASDGTTHTITNGEYLAQGIF